MSGLDDVRLVGADGGRRSENWAVMSESVETRKVSTQAYIPTLAGFNQVTGTASVCTTVVSYKLHFL